MFLFDVDDVCRWTYLLYRIVTRKCRNKIATFLRNRIFWNLQILNIKIIQIKSMSFKFFLMALVYIFEYNYVFYFSIAENLELILQFYNFFVSFFWTIFLKIFFDKLFGQIFWTHFLDTFLDTFWTHFLDNFFS